MEVASPLGDSPDIGEESQSSETFLLSGPSPRAGLPTIRETSMDASGEQQVPPPTRFVAPGRLSTVSIEFNPEFDGDGDFSELLAEGQRQTSMDSLQSTASSILNTVSLSPRTKRPVQAIDHSEPEPDLELERSNFSFARAASVTSKLPNGARAARAPTWHTSESTLPVPGLFSRLHTSQQQHSSTHAVPIRRMESRLIGNVTPLPPKADIDARRKAVRARWREYARVVMFSISRARPGNRRMLRQEIHLENRSILAARVQTDRVLVLYAGATLGATTVSVVSYSPVGAMLLRSDLTLSRSTAPLAGLGTAAFTSTGDVVGLLCEPPLGRSSSAASSSGAQRSGFKTTLMFLRVAMAELHQLGRITLDARARCLAWAPAGDRVAVGCDRGEFRVVRFAHEGETGCEVRVVHASTVPRAAADVVVAAWNSAGTRVAVGTKSNVVAVLDVTADTWTVVSEANHIRTYAVAFSSPKEAGAAERVLIGSDDCKVHIADAARAAAPRAIAAHADYVRAIACSTDGKLLVTGSKDGVLKLFDLRTAEQFGQYRSARIDMIEVSSDEHTSQIAVGGLDGTGGSVRSLVLYNFRDHVSAADISSRANTHEKAVTTIASSPDGSLVASGSADKKCVVFELLSGRTIAVFEDHTALVTCIAFHPIIPNLLVTGCEDRCVRLFEMDNLTVRFSQLPSLIMSIAFTSDGLGLLVGMEAIAGRPHFSTLELFDASTFALIHSFADSTRSALSVACHPLEREYLAGFSDGSVRMYGNDHALRWHQCAHKKEIFSVAISPDGTHVASGSRDKLVIVYRADNGHELARIDDATNWVRSVVFCDHFLVCGSTDEVVRVYDRRLGYASRDFQSRLRVFRQQKGIYSLSAIPMKSIFAGLVVIGSGDGKINFIDISLTDQQPTYTEAVAVIQYDRDCRHAAFPLTQAMVARYPLTVYCADKSGFSLFHHAVVREEHRLLSILLAAAVPRFWLPVNRDGHDALHYASKSRVCVKLILSAYTSSKAAGHLSIATLAADDRLLRNLMALIFFCPDLVSAFLKSLQFDEAAEDVSARLRNLRTNAKDNLVDGTEDPQARDVWAALQRRATADSLLSPQLQGGTLRPLLCSVPNVASILGSGPRSPRNSLLHSLLAAENPHLFGNFLMRRVIQFKWETYARRLFLKEIALYLLYLGLFLTFSVLMVRRPEGAALPDLVDDRDSLTCVVLCLAIPLYAIRTLVLSYRQLRGYPMKEDTDDSALAARPPHPPRHPNVKALRTTVRRCYLYFSIGWNTLQVAVAALSLTACLCYLIGSREVRNVSAVCAVLSWIQVLHFLRAFAWTGGLVRMIFKVLRQSIPYVAIIAIVLVGCSNAFFILTSDLNDSDNELAVFRRADTLGQSMFAMYLILMLGEFQDTVSMLALGPRTTLLTLLFCLFTLVVFIFMLNLMINLMGDFMAQIQKDEGDAFPFEKAQIIAELEHSLSERRLNDPHWFPTWLVVLSPKEASASTEDDHGPAAAIRAETERALRLQAEFMRRVEDLLEKKVHPLPARARSSTTQQVHLHDSTVMASDA
eukprot:m.96577 g.96577  ORF g.96577 m.96577 type:complete len:1549 (+) comp13947_c0_seq4:32-4678(+)